MTSESNVIGGSSFAARLRREIPKLAKSQNHVLLIGEPGTGRGFVAQLIHAASGSDKEFLSLNPISSTEARIQDILNQPPANTARVLIRDIEDFSFLLQSRIQRFVDGLPRRPFIQAIVTSKSTLSELHKKHRLTDGLYDTLRSFTGLTIAPLRDRAEDIPLLAEEFIRSACESIGATPKAIDINALDFLVRRDWKENVKELQSVIESAVLGSKDDVVELPGNLVDEMGQLAGIIESIASQKAFAFDMLLSNLEKTLIQRTLAGVGNNQTKAAEILRLSEANLRYRLKKFKILQSRQAR